jgi:hypothetical protein
MGKILTVDERCRLLKWAEAFKPDHAIAIWTPVSKCFRRSAERELRNYWGLARTARNGKVPGPIRTAAHQHLFSIRTKIEKWLGNSALQALNAAKIDPSELLDGTVFGCSLKQGVSFRLPLSSCQPTGRCAGGCYAHDGLDASISTVIRGALNGAFAQHFEESVDATRRSMMEAFTVPLRKAVFQALRECDHADFTRQARIRMSHVGELTAYPAFANTMAAMVRDLSGGRVASVVYTRHRNAALLDPKLFVINFTLDEVSLNRRSWAPKEARIVFSAWEGRIRDDVSVNFLEHHHLAHTESYGGGKICPATRPETSNKTCDGVHCNFCFRPPNRAE